MKTLLVFLSSTAKIKPVPLHVEQIFISQTIYIIIIYYIKSSEEQGFKVITKKTTLFLSST